MPIYISGSTNTCAGSIRGVFSGSLAAGHTASYQNMYIGGVCTGSLLVYNTPDGRGQQLWIRLSGSGANPDGMEWVFVTGSTGATNPVNMPE